MSELILHRGGVEVSRDELDLIHVQTLPKPILILFGAIDLLGGIWTFITLKTEI